MKLLASNKFLGTLLAVVFVGMGAQSYYLIQVHRQLSALKVQAEEPTTAFKFQTTDEQTADPQGLANRIDPFAGLDQAEARMSKLFDSFYDRFNRNFDGLGLDDSAPMTNGDSFFLGSAGLLGPRVDLQEHDDTYELTVDLPGAKETDVVVRIEDQMLIVEGSRETVSEVSEPGSFVRRERQFGRFERRLALPHDALGSTLRTEFDNGVLKVTLNKQS